MSNKLHAVFLAFLAAVFYAINTPLSKILLGEVPATYMAGFLYFGAGIGMSVLFAATGSYHADNKLIKSDFPYVLGMVLLDILAPILLMFGLQMSSASEVALLNNFEIVATALIALLLFREKISKRLWCGIVFIVLASMLLSLDTGQRVTFQAGALLVLGATCCWGLENNCTRKISERNTYQIVMIKGLCSGMGSILIAAVRGEAFPKWTTVLMVMGLGFIAYGMSIFFYIRAQKELGAAKTSAYYAVAPFVGAILSFLILKEPFSSNYFIAGMVMVIGSAIVVYDTLASRYEKNNSD